MSFLRRWAVLAVTWGLSRALFEKVGSAYWGVGTEFLLALALLPLLQALVVGRFLGPSPSGPVAVVLRLLVPLVPLQLAVTVGIAWLFRHVDLRPHVFAALFAIPAMQGAVLASLVPPWRRGAGDDPPSPARGLLWSPPALLLTLLLAGLAAEFAFGWFLPALSRLLPRWPHFWRGLAGYAALLALAMAALLRLRSRASSSPPAPALLDAAAALLLASAIGAVGQYYQRPFLVPPWSTLLPAGLYLSAGSALAALVSLALSGPVEPRRGP